MPLTQQQVNDLTDKISQIQSVMAEIEGERIALIDAWRSQMEGQGVPPTTAALIVQDVLDRATPYRRASDEDFPSNQNMMGGIL